MARQPRLSLNGQLHHVLLRGNGQQTVFADDEDRALWLSLLVRYAPDMGVDVHAWALMPDHIHLLLTPRLALPAVQQPVGSSVVPPVVSSVPPALVQSVALRPAGDLSGFIQALGRAYVQAFNRRHGRRGSLWEGRYRSTVLEPHPWLLRAMVWMDSHPLRSGLAEQAGAHPWTSAAHYLGQTTARCITVPPQYWALGNTPFAREAAYRTLLEQGGDATSVSALAQASLKGWALGSPAFVAALQLQSPRRLEKRRPGRPVTRIKSEDGDLQDVMASRS